MTAMNALIEDNGITLSMDTLVSTRKKNGKVVPYYYTQKFEYYPFTKSILCGTGDFNVIQKVMNFSKKILSKEVETFTELIDDFLIENHFSKSKETSTIYILGFDDNLLPHAFALRSTNDYSIEEVANYNHPNFLMKPSSVEISKYFSLLKNTENSDDLFKKIMRKEKEIDDNTAQDKRVGIGGENILISVLPYDGKLMSVCKTIDVFDDYDNQYNYCLKHINN